MHVNIDFLIILHLGESNIDKSHPVIDSDPLMVVTLNEGLVSYISTAKKNGTILLD
jgi:hypothetical protein